MIHRFGFSFFILLLLLLCRVFRTDAQIAEIDGAKVLVSDSSVNHTLDSVVYRSDNPESQSADLIIHKDTSREDSAEMRHTLVRQIDEKDTVQKYIQKCLDDGSDIMFLNGTRSVSILRSQLRRAGVLAERETSSDINGYLGLKIKIDKNSEIVDCKIVVNTVKNMTFENKVLGFFQHKQFNGFENYSKPAEFIYILKVIRESENDDSKIEAVQTEKENETENVLNTTDDSIEPSKNNHKLTFLVNCSYFYYHERIRIEDLILSFENTFGRPLDTIDGTPKSNEYGFNTGLGVMFTQECENGLFFRPQLGIQMGLLHTYDGSTQGQPLVVYDHDFYSYDTIGLRFYPIDTTKTNIFLNTEIDLGYSLKRHKRPFIVYSGLKFNFWNRDLGSNLYFKTYENYWWCSIPVGIIMNKTTTSGIYLGFEFSADFMFYGGMKAYAYLRDDSQNGIEFPEVTLGNKTGYHLQFDIGKGGGGLFSMKFSPYINIYGFGKSNMETAKINNGEFESYGSEEIKFDFYEPQSGTMKIGFNLLFDLNFSAVNSSN